MRTRSLVVLAGCALGAGLTLTACGTSEPPAASTHSAPESTDTTTAAPPSEEPSATADSPTLRGNAAANPACALLTTTEVAEAAGLAVNAILGLVSDNTNPAKHSESCTWLLDSKEVQSSLVVQYTVYAKRPADLLAYYPQVIAQGFGTKVAGLGDLSKIQGHVLDTIYRRAEIHVSLLTHAEATAADQAAAVGLMRIVMAGIVQ